MAEGLTDMDRLREIYRDLCGESEAKGIKLIAAERDFLLGSIRDYTTETLYHQVQHSDTFLR